LVTRWPCRCATSPVAAAISRTAASASSRVSSGLRHLPQLCTSIVSLIATCKLDGVRRYGYLGDAITRIVGGHPCFLDRLQTLWPKSDNRDRSVYGQRLAC
jgi:hypothetical protein